MHLYNLINTIVDHCLDSIMTPSIILIPRLWLVYKTELSHLCHTRQIFLRQCSYCRTYISCFTRIHIENLSLFWATTILATRLVSKKQRKLLGISSLQTLTRLVSKKQRKLLGISSLQTLTTHQFFRCMAPH